MKLDIVSTRSLFETCAFTLVILLLCSLETGFEGSVSEPVNKLHMKTSLRFSAAHPFNVFSVNPKASDAQFSLSWAEYHH